LKDGAATAAAIFLVGGVLDAAHEGRRVRAKLMRAVTTDAVIQCYIRRVGHCIRGTARR
jgi:Trm5-related predicted tRNA methylase